MNYGDKVADFEKLACECDDAIIALTCAISHMDVSTQINRSHGRILLYSHG